MKAEMIDGVRVPGWKMTYWVSTDRVRYGLVKRKEGFWRFIAFHTPTEWKRWVLVHCAVRAMGANNGPDYATYKTMCDALDSDRPIPSW